jgi:hypothetical protein
MAATPLTPIASQAWVAFVSPLARRQLSVFRTWPDLVGCETPDGLWVRVNRPDPSRDSDLIRRLRLETAAEIFEVTQSGELIPLGCRVPTKTLPDGPWVPLRELLSVNWPVAGFAGKRPVGWSLRLVRSDQEIEPTVLELDLATWANAVSTMPQIRLARWEFAASLIGRVLVRGLPLPSLSGERFYERDGLVIPAGYRWEPAVTPAVVRRLLQSTTDEWLLWRAEANRWERIPTAAFVPARRANVRQTVMELPSHEVEA